MLALALLWLCVREKMFCSPAPCLGIWTSPCSSLHSVLLDPALYFIGKWCFAKGRTKS